MPGRWDGGNTVALAWHGTAWHGTASSASACLCQTKAGRPTCRHDSKVDVVAKVALRKPSNAKTRLSVSISGTLVGRL